MNQKKQHNILEHLHYGAYVIISTPSENKTQQYLYSDGFIAKRIFMKEFTKDTEEDIFGSVFRILPPFKFDVQQKVQNGSFYQKDDRKDLQSQLEQEIKQNIDNFNKVKNDSVLFGQSIQLQHVKSQKYLSLRSYSQKQMDQDQQFSYFFNNYDHFLRIILDDTPSSSTHLSLKSCYKFQEEYTKLITFQDDTFITSHTWTQRRESYLYIPEQHETINQKSNEDDSQNEIKYSYHHKRLMMKSNIYILEIQYGLTIFNQVPYQILNANNPSLLLNQNLEQPQHQQLINQIKKKIITDILNIMVIIQLLSIYIMRIIKQVVECEILKILYQ